MASQIREIIFDTETTGLSPKNGDRVIEIGAVELINRFPTGKTFHVFINPEDKEVHPDALEIHGISNDFLKDKPTFGDILDDFLEFFSEGNLVAHNADFDVGFLNAELHKLRATAINPERVVDTLAIARRKFPGQRNSLDALCHRFAIDNSHREKHGALLDSELLAEVYIELLGGKQASLTLDNDETATETGGAADARNVKNSKIYKRPKPLPSRLSEADIESHRQFIKSLGDDMLWNKLGL